MASSKGTDHTKAPTSARRTAQSHPTQSKKSSKKTIESRQPVAQPNPTSKSRSLKKRDNSASPTKLRNDATCEELSDPLHELPPPKMSKGCKIAREVSEAIPDSDDHVSESSMEIPQHSALGFLDAFGASLYSSGSMGKYITGLSSSAADSVMSSLEELNDYLNMSSDDVAFRLPLSKLLPLLMTHLSRRQSMGAGDDPGRRMLLSAQILSSIVDSSPAATDAISKNREYVSQICVHIAEMEYLDLADQCVVILSRMCKDHGMDLLRFGAIGVILGSIEFFAISTQNQCMQIVSDILLCCRKDANLSQVSDQFDDHVLAKLSPLLAHPDSGISAKVSSCWRVAIDLRCAMKKSSLANLSILSPVVLNHLDNPHLIEGVAKLASAHSNVASWLLDRLEETIFPLLSSEKTAVGALRLCCAILPGFSGSGASGGLDKDRLVVVQRSGKLDHLLSTILPHLIARQLALFPLCIQTGLVAAASGALVDWEIFAPIFPYMSRVAGSRIAPFVARLVDKISGTPALAARLAREGVPGGHAPPTQKWDKTGVSAMLGSDCTAWELEGNVKKLGVFLAAPKNRECLSLVTSGFMARLVGVLERGLLPLGVGAVGTLVPGSSDTLFSELVNRPVRVALQGAGKSATHMMVEPFTPVRALQSFLVDYDEEFMDDDEEDWDEDRWQEEEETRDAKSFKFSLNRVPIDDDLITVLEVVLGVDDLHGSPKEVIPEGRLDLESLWNSALGTPFEQRLWNTLHTIQYEEVTSTALASPVSKKLSPKLTPSPAISLLSLLGKSRPELQTVSVELDEHIAAICGYIEVIASRRFPPWVAEVLAQCPWLVSVETRRKYFCVTSFGLQRCLGALVPPMRQKVRVMRDRILESALVAMNMFGPTQGVRNPPMIELEFIGEEGTGSGPTNEFFTLVADHLKAAGLDLFRVCADGTLFPAVAKLESTDWDAFTEHSQVLGTGTGSLPGVAPSLLDLWRLMGLLVGRALLDNRLVDLHLSSEFWERVVDTGMGKRWGKGDLAQVDPHMANSLAAMQKMTPADLADLSLASFPGRPEIVFEKCRDVDSFAKQVAEWTLVKGVRYQVRAFTEALLEVVNPLGLFLPRELACLVVGGERPEYWSVTALSGSMHASHGFNNESRAFVDFVAVVSELTPSEKSSFVQFVTGSKSLPAGGFSALKPAVTVVKAANPGHPDNYLPSVMTCAHFIKLPEYSSKAVLRNRLITAISEGQGSFLLS